jgi:hypothetical protein
MRAASIQSVGRLSNDEAIRLVLLGFVEKPHRLFVNGQDDAACLTKDLVTGARLVNAQGACMEGALLIPLASGKHDDVLITFMRVTGNGGGFTETQQRCSRPGNAIPIESMDLHTGTERFPGKFVLPLSDVKKGGQFNQWESRDGGRVSHANEGAQSLRMRLRCG